MQAAGHWFDAHLCVHMNIAPLLMDMYVNMTECARIEAGSIRRLMSSHADISCTLRIHVLHTFGAVRISFTCRMQEPVCYFQVNLFPLFRWIFLADIFSLSLSPFLAVHCSGKTCPAIS